MGAIVCMQTTAPLKKNSGDLARRYYISFTALVCVGVFSALAALTMWHARLITNGETSIEAHINKKERLRLGKEGIVSNWQDLGLLVFSTRVGWFLRTAHPPLNETRGEGKIGFNYW